MSSLSSDDVLLANATVTKVEGRPDFRNISLSRMEISNLLQTAESTLAETKRYGHALLALTDTQWLEKAGVSALVPTPDHPGIFVGTEFADRVAYEHKFNQYNTYRRADKAGVRLLMTIYDKNYFVDLHDGQGQLIGHATKELLGHLEDTYVDPDDLEEEIQENEVILQADYDPNESTETYWARLKNCQRLATAMNEKMEDDKIMRIAFLQFRKHANLADATADWKDIPPAI